MPNPTIRGIELKIQRAEFHYRSLETQLRNFQDLYAKVFVPQVVNNGYKHLYWAHDPPALDPRWSAIIGDCVHNLRSALDHLACQLVIAHGGDPNRATNFPILDKPPFRPACSQYPRWTHLPRRHGRPEPLRVRGGIDPAALQIVESVQPYKGTDTGHMLSLLGNLDNLDKHRDLTVVAMAVRGAKTHADYGPFLSTHGGFLSVTVPLDTVGALTTTGPIRHDEVAAFMTYPQPQVDPDPNLELLSKVVFAKGSVAATFRVLPLLASFIGTVRDGLLPQFCPFVPPGS